MCTLFVVLDWLSADQKLCKSLADPGGRRPQQDQFLLFSHMFLPKSVRIGGWHPPNGSAPPPPPTGYPGSATANDACHFDLISCTYCLLLLAQIHPFYVRLN